MLLQKNKSQPATALKPPSLELTPNPPPSVDTSSKQSYPPGCIISLNVYIRHFFMTFNVMIQAVQAVTNTPIWSSSINTQSVCQIWLVISFRTSSRELDFMWLGNVTDVSLWTFYYFVLFRSWTVIGSSRPDGVNGAARVARLKVYSSFLISLKV